MPTPNPHRLNRDVIPSAYRLDLDTDLDTGRFGGTVVIDATVAAATDVIVCNAAGLDVTGAELRTADGVQHPRVELDDATERLLLHLDDPLPAGDAELHLTFEGEFAALLVGYYRSTYGDNGAVASMGVTQFEAPYARRAFPCWDEPDFKATFEISLTCADDLSAVSNAREVATTDLGDGRTRHDFAPTMRMSTYLVAWVIGDLETSRTVRSRETDIRVLHRPGQGHLTDFALDCAAHCIAWFEDYYGIAYPGDKLDLIAVPDFAFGAMENLGCVTFRENLLLIDPEQANRSEQERAATVIAHEIAHMWFGDLVTMTWWNGIWLNEAFATFMELCCTDAYRPDWEVWTSFGLSKSQAFDTDALAHTRPIEFEVVTPADAEAMFDILTYEKGAAVLRMFEQWAGPDTFRDGVRRYLSAHAYGNTDTPDLWAALSDATGIDVGAVMDSWILQGGHPLLTVTPTDDGVAIRQQRAGFAGGDPTPGDERWLVPLRIEGTAGGRPFEQSSLLTDATTTIDLGGRPDMVNANAGFGGFYRTEYDAALRAALLAGAAALTPLDRYALLDDAWALFLAGRLELVELATVARRVAEVETEASVWRRIAGVAAGLGALADSGEREPLRGFVRELVADRLGPDAAIAPLPEGAGRDLRAVLFRLAGVIGADAAVIAEARRWFGERPGAPQDDPDLAAAVVDVAAAHGGVAEYDALLRLYRDASTPQEELRALSALGQFPDAELTARLCEMCRTEVRSQNAPYVLAQAMANPVTGVLVWEFVAAHWDELVGRFPSSSIARMVGGIRAFSEPGLVADIGSFFEAHPVTNAALTVQQHLERVRVNVAARERLGADALRPLG